MIRFRVACGLSAALACLSLASAGWTQEPQTPPGQQPGPALTYSGFDKNQGIKPGFVVSVAVSTAAGPETEVSGVFPVDGSGAIVLKLAGRVELAGLTPTQAGAKIAAALASFLKEPKVTLSTIAVPKPIIYLGGAISRTGSVAIEPAATLGDVLIISGYTADADLSRVRVIRLGDSGRSEQVFDLNRWMRPAEGEVPDTSQNPTLMDKDTILVPFRTAPAIGSVEVSGDVLRPSSIPLRYGVPTRLREVISSAGGLNPTASHTITVRRTGSDRAFTVDYDKAESGDPQHDILINDRDTVFVARQAGELFLNVNGGFARPGRIPYRGKMTLTQAIGDAGGLLLYAKEKEGTIIRNVGSDPSKTQPIRFNYRDIREGRVKDVQLQPGDIVEIPPGGPPAVRPDPVMWVTGIITAYALLRSSQQSR